nr:2-phospho-L-lactate transferase CofD family protein [Photobacterium damselae]
MGVTTKVSTHTIPMSEYPADLAAMTPSGEIICGETSVDELIEVPQRLYVDPAVPATKEAVVAIEQADLILLGPGSFLTSVMPSLLLKEIAQALKHTSARLVFITNLDKENGPAGQMDLATMLHWCERSIGGRRIDIILSDKYYDELESSYHQHVSDLAANNHVWRHDRNKLKHAIEQLLIA